MASQKKKSLGSKSGGDDDDPGSIEKIYQKKTQLEHILIRPDTYIGSVEMYQQYLWVFDKEHQKIVYREVKYVPGLYKIFGKILFSSLNSMCLCVDEILVNAADNY